MPETFSATAVKRVDSGGHRAGPVILFALIFVLCCWSFVAMKRNDRAEARYQADRAYLLGVHGDSVWIGGALAKVDNAQRTIYVPSCRIARRAVMPGQTHPWFAGYGGYAYQCRA